MARKTTVELIDDLDKTSVADTTVGFALDGVSYEIDLTDEHARELRDLLAPYVESGTKLGRTGTGRPGPRQSRSAASREAAAIREWWRAQDPQAPERGRIPVQIRKAYHDGVALSTLDAAPADTSAEDAASGENADASAQTAVKDETAKASQRKSKGGKRS